MQTSLQAMTDSNDRTARSIQKMAENDSNRRARETDNERRERDRHHDRTHRNDQPPKHENPRNTDRYANRDNRDNRHRQQDTRRNDNRDNNRNYQDRRKEQQPRGEPRGATSTTQCFDYMLGVCKRTSCRYSHEGRRVCRFFTRNGGTCTKEGCPMPHALIECPQHMKNACNRGNECRFSHDATATKNV